MSLDRRHFLRSAGAASLAALGATLAPVRDVHAADYKAVVVLFLSGGHDGNNMLVPTDAAYGDYSKARPSLALPRDSLVPLSGSHIGHSFGLSPALRALAPLFEQKRMAIIANAGALVEPVTPAQVKQGSARLPPFLGSHSEQSQWIQGWMGDEDLSGWGGRMLDNLPDALKQRQPLIALAQERTAVLASRTPLSLTNSYSGSRWGRVDLQGTDVAQQRLEWASRLQSANAFEAEFSKSLRVAYLDALEFAKGQQFPTAPTGTFPEDVQIGRDLRYVARHLAYSKQGGARRQVYLVEDGGYDTHTGQLSTDAGNPGLEARLVKVATSVAALDASIRAYGMDEEVTVLIMSEFGRTLDPAAGVGSDHAWGNHWFALGGGVQGGKVYGSAFPTLQIGGPDDASIYNMRGQWAPQFSSDQFIGDVARWMGLTAEQVLTAMPNLRNFARPTIGYL